MYEVSEKYRRAIRGRSREFEWRGIITTKAGKVYRFSNKDIVKGSALLLRLYVPGVWLRLRGGTGYFPFSERRPLQPIRCRHRPVLCLPTPCGPLLERYACNDVGRGTAVSLE